MSIIKSYAAHFNYNKLYLILPRKIVVLNPDKATIRMRDKNRSIWHGCKHLFIDLFPEKYVKWWLEKIEPGNIPKKLSKNKYIALSQFYNILDKKVVLFLSKIPYTQWQLLRNILKHNGFVKQFIFENPALSYLILNYSRKNFTFHRLITRKRRNMLSLLNIPEEERFVKIISKISPENLYRVLCGSLLELLNKKNLDKEKIKILSHAKNVNLPLVFALSENFYQYIDRKFLFELSEMNNSPKLKKIYFAMVNILMAMIEAQELGLNYRIRIIRNENMLFYEEKRALGIEDEKFSFANIKFPPPPFKGNAYIEPIKTSRELYLESDLMHHCIKNFANEIANGNYYAYRVNFKGKNYSLMLKKLKDKWYLYDVRGKRNSFPSKKVMKIVEEWCEINGIILNN